ncbi:hypothetical protein CVT24_002832, partial [Panaeolus cyanescens]
LFLLAGHETSAHTLCFALVLIAAHPDVQAKILIEAMALWPEGPPTLDYFTHFKDSKTHLEYTHGVMYETLRLHPPVTRLGKRVNRPTTIPGHRFDVDEVSGCLRNVEEFQTPVDVGGVIVLDIYGLHLNPMYWGTDAAKFQPERFIDREGYTWPRDGFAAFSLGPRTCIGQRFAVAEVVCVIAALVRQFEILLPTSCSGSPVESEEMMERMLAWKTGVTISPKDARIRLMRRQD